ncbi:MAG: porin [Zoogloea sp.]|nr:porin [Zoogloea sp.]
MKKASTILTAILGGLLFIGADAALAQVDYSVYGVADLSYGAFGQSGLARDVRFNSNSLSPSFVGVTGSYGFDDGWSVAAVAETFIRFHDFKTGRRDSDPLLSRNAFIALRSNDYGALRFGRLQTLIFDTTNRFNALGNSPLSPAIRQLFFSGNIEGVDGDFYWDNAVGYTSPSFEGLSFNLMHAAQKNEERGNYQGGSVVWSVGLLSLEAAAQNVHVNDGIKDPTRETTWQLGSSYNFGFARVFGLYSQVRDRGLDARSKLASAGVSLPLGPGSLLFQVGSSTTEGAAIDRKHTTISSAYLYEYDSATDIYVIGMDDRVRGQSSGQSVALGVRFKF